MVADVLIDLTEGSPPVGVPAWAPQPTDELTERILDAALALVARWGVGKTALADVAKEAGCSRATLYRAFPGGKQHRFTAMGLRELATYRQGVVDAIASADDLGEALTRGLVVATRLVRDHPAAQFVLEHEPGYLLPFLGFKQVDVVYRASATSVGPNLERFLPPDRARWAAEWATRLLISYLFNPDPELDLGVADDARHLVERYVLPALSTSTSTPTR
ncbi:MAG: TetR/AcrR family transcriptional regulator [Acidimicrobiales bacterium]